MATVACPGCGLPRVESELGAKPCPVCDSAPVAAPARAKPVAGAPDPTAGLPADVSELYAPAAAGPARASEARPWLVYCAVAFLFGMSCGVGGVLGVQALARPEQKADGPEVAAGPKGDPPAAPATGPARPAPPPDGAGGGARPAPPPAPGAPPRPGGPPTPEPGPKPAAAEPVTDSEPGPDVKQIKPPVPGHVETHEFNEPKDTYSVPPLKRGEHVVLKGKEKVKALRVHGLDAGAVLDASALDVSVITVTGKIDNGSKLKLKAPGGTVHLSGKIDGRSVVEIDAPGGEVKFTAQTTPRNDGSKIDNGSAVTITARVIEFKGDISGADTKVAITLTRNAWLKVASVSGRAAVEYRSQMAAWSPPDVIVGPVAPTATFRKIE